MVTFVIGAVMLGAGILIISIVRPRDGKRAAFMIVHQIRFGVSQNQSGQSVKKETGSRWSRSKVEEREGDYLRRSIPFASPFVQSIPTVGSWPCSRSVKTGKRVHG